MGSSRLLNLMRGNHEAVEASRELCVVTTNRGFDDEDTPVRLFVLCFFLLLACSVLDHLSTTFNELTSSPDCSLLFSAAYIRSKVSPGKGLADREREFCFAFWLF